VTNFQYLHARRLFYGATHKFNDNVRIATGLEFLANLNELNGGEAGAFEDIRVNWDASVNATLIERLSLEVKFRLQYDRVPAATENLDTNTVISVIYSLL
jgi:putative salt-induced outer membrane protein YdiY